MKEPVNHANTCTVADLDTFKKIRTSITHKVRISTSFPDLIANFFISACKQYLDEFNLPDAYDVPGSSVPGSQTKTFTVNSVQNNLNSGDGPGALDYDMDGSLMGYYPLKVRLLLVRPFY